LEDVTPVNAVISPILIVVAVMPGALAVGAPPDDEGVVAVVAVEP
jgi:hypothetical protein